MREAALAEEAARLAELEEVKRREALLEAEQAQMRLEREEAARARAREQATDKQGGKAPPDIYKDVEDVDTSELLDVISRFRCACMSWKKIRWKGVEGSASSAKKLRSWCPTPFA